MPEILDHNYSIFDFRLTDLDFVENPPVILNLDDAALIHHDQKSDVTNLNETDCNLLALNTHSHVVSHTPEQENSDETDEYRANKL